MVSIVGAGPVGNYLAWKLADKGVDVDVYEEHTRIGCPVACTGILTSCLKDFVKLKDDFVMNKVNQTTVYAPNGEFVNFKLKNNFVIDREVFDCFLADEAKSAGVKLHLGWKFLRMKKNVDAGLNSYDLFFNKKREKSDVFVVGADGPNSVVAKSAGILGKKDFIVGHQARVRLKDKMDSSLVEFFLDKGDYIGWVVPESNNVVRMGVASKKGVKGHFKELIRKRPGKILEWQSGVIPVYDPKIVSEKDGVYLLGDAATQVKATTYGGIIPGMHAGNVLADVIVNELKDGTYNTRWKKGVGKSLFAHLMIRKMMNKFEKKDYNDIISLCKQDKIKNLISKHEREYPISLLTKIGLKEPRFLKYIKYLF
jgi:digeranylgeranylglycerophospholipid reductase